MFKINDYVDHRRSGVCRIQDIAALSGDDSGAQYFVLQPLFGEDKNTILRVPVTNTSSLSPVMEKSQALELIKKWDSIGEYYEMDSKKRKLNYETAISSGDLSLIAPLIEGVKQRKLRDGKLNSMDQQFLLRAEPLLFGELAIALGIPYEEVDGFIRSTIG